MMSPAKKAFIICSAFFCVIGGVMLAVNPGLADVAYDENNLFENLSVIFCSIALLLSINLLFKRWGLESERSFWALVSFLLFIFIGDDLSWGMGYLWHTEPVIAGVKLDGVHDIFSISIGIVKHLRDYIRSIGISDIRSIGIIVSTALTAILAAYFFIMIFAKKREYITAYFRRNLRWEPFLFFFIALLLIALSLLVDDDNLVSFPHKTVVEESMEILAAVAFLFSSLTGLKGRTDV